MRKLLFVASVALFAAFGCQNGGVTGTSSDSDSTKVHVPSSKVAYINLDSLVSKYDLYLDLRSAYETKAKKIETEVGSKGRSFERDVADFQNKIQKGLVTQSEAMRLEEDLQRKQQNMVQYRDRVLQEMAEEEAVMLNRIHHSIVDFLAEFNKDYRYAMILSTSGGTPILNADPALDLTKEVVEGLNKKYRKEKEAEAKAKPATK